MAERKPKVATFVLEIASPESPERVLHVNQYDEPMGYVWIGEGDGPCYGCLRDKDVERLHARLGDLIEARARGRAGRKRGADNA
jgi:hypothetical protein